MRPPATPTFGGQRTFEDIEKQLGTPLPTDYKEFISIYGTGSIEHFIWVLNPFVDNEHLNLISEKSDILDAYTVLKNEFPHHFKHEVYPNKNGLLPWGITDNGDELFWLTDGTPDHWNR
ncbi:hypothetical protein GCM10011571_32090 [Marinithermofilum abyssi]|uniref:Knr4/Smi1-like domain-containing protein n=1 Tax=Marinithermofilum abyssi TaxID=1571185 RepID=A0A8J2VJN2_9BACL|nr:SMI1/KNR4 family protein [Marinithermofilum abyssi]GGE27443.1 hypothetical protein GCM10011571_32090 [Marinithermofilum abyssi]